MNLVNHQFRLAARPVGMPKRSDWSYTEEPVREPARRRAPGQGALHLARPGHARLDERRQVLHRAGRDRRGHARARRRPRDRVRRSRLRGRRHRHRHLRRAGIRDCRRATGVIKVDASFAPLPVYLSALGMPGMTAYFGLLDVGQPQGRARPSSSRAPPAPSARSSARSPRSRAAASSASPAAREKCHYVVNELGFDAAIDYKAEDLSRRRLREALPEGRRRLFRQRRRRDPRRRAAFSQHGGRASSSAARSRSTTTRRRSRARPTTCRCWSTARAWKGFVVFDYADRYGEGLREMAGWMAAGKLKSREDIVDGPRNLSRNAAQALQGRELRQADPQGRRLLSISASSGRSLDEDRRSPERTLAFAAPPDSRPGAAGRATAPARPA